MVKRGYGFGQTGEECGQQGAVDTRINSTLGGGTPRLVVFKRGDYSAPSSDAVPLDPVLTMKKQVGKMLNLMLI